MFNKNYSNFVRPSHNDDPRTTKAIEHVPLSGDEAKEIYLNEIKQIKRLPITECDKDNIAVSSHRERRIHNVKLSDKDLFLSVQNDDVKTLKLALDTCPDNVNKLDEFGWSLLMIACQANSIEAAKELVKRGIDTSVRDKAGNSAQSLIIKNKNYALVDVLLSNKSFKREKTSIKPHKSESAESSFCDICSIQFSNREQHLSSTIHNINLSKGKKLPTNYVIPETNRGYQLMLKVGWDKDSGLGPSGLGKKYPIKTVQKQDRKGLGHNQKRLKVDKEEETVRHKNRKIVAKDRESSRKMEINFRRQFY